MNITLANLNQRIVRPALAWMPPNFRSQTKRHLPASKDINKYRGKTN